MMITNDNHLIRGNHNSDTKTNDNDHNENGYDYY